MIYTMCVDDYELVCDGPSASHRVMACALETWLKISSLSKNDCPCHVIEILTINMGEKNRDALLSL